MKTMVVAAILFGCAAAPAGAAGSSPCDLIRPDVANMFDLESSELLKVGDFQKLEAAMEAQYQELLAAGNGDHLFDVRAFLNLGNSPGNRLLLQWKKEMPNAFSPTT